MIYTGYQLLWFLLIYSFVGWIGEVAYAAVKHHKFLNRGFVTGPVCPIYGVGAVAFSVILPDLRGNLIFLFLGGMILASGIEYATGKGLYRLTGRKWWDYSHYPFHVEGYISLASSAVWGVCAIIVMMAGNPLVCRLIRLIPKPLGWILVWTMTGMVIADLLGSLIAVLGWKKNEGILRLKHELGKTSRLLENALTRSIQNRMLRAFPDSRVKEEETVFAAGCGIYKLVMIFVIAAFLGDIVETIFMFATTGKIVCRSSLVYGQFSVVWGFACVLATMFLYQFRDRKILYIFLWGTVLGGAYEYFCSVISQVLFGAVFWNYSGFAFNLGGRINLLFCFFWGLASVIWIRGIYPLLSEMIEKIPLKAGRVFCKLLVLFLILDALISSAALMRYTARNKGKAPETFSGKLVDERFPDSRMEKRYPYMRFR